MSRQSGDPTRRAGDDRRRGRESSAGRTAFDLGRIVVLASVLVVGSAYVAATVVEYGPSPEVLSALVESLVKVHSDVGLAVVGAFAGGLLGARTSRTDRWRTVAAASFGVVAAVVGGGIVLDLLGTALGAVGSARPLGWIQAGLLAGVATALTGGVATRSGSVVALDRSSVPSGGSLFAIAAGAVLAAGLVGVAVVVFVRAGLGSPGTVVRGSSESLYYVLEAAFTLARTRLPVLAAAVGVVAGLRYGDRASGAVGAGVGAGYLLVVGGLWAVLAAVGNPSTPPEGVVTGFRYSPELSVTWTPLKIGAVGVALWASTAGVVFLAAAIARGDDGLLSEETDSSLGDWSPTVLGAGVVAALGSATLLVLVGSRLLSSGVPSDPVSWVALVAGLTTQLALDSPVVLGAVVGLLVLARARSERTTEGIVSAATGGGVGTLVLVVCTGVPVIALGGGRIAAQFVPRAVVLVACVALSAGAVAAVLALERRSSTPEGSVRSEPQAVERSS